MVGEAGDGASALREFQRLRPDVVILDIQLPDISGFEVTRQLAAEGSGAAIVLVSSREASDYRRRLAVSTARGFIAKAALSGASLGALLGAGP